MESSSLDIKDAIGLSSIAVLIAIEWIVPYPREEWLVALVVIMVLSGSLSLSRLMLLEPFSKTFGRTFAIGFFVFALFMMMRVSKFATVMIMFGWASVWYLLARTFGLKRRAI